MPEDYGDLFFVDTESTGPCPSLGQLEEFGIVHYASRDTFHGVLTLERAQKRGRQVFGPYETWPACEVWVNTHMPKGKNHPVFVSDNPAWDFMWMTDGFHRTLGRSPFGHSGRRISDYYAGLMGNFRKSQQWKRLRVTVHDHQPVHDAMGNVEAFERLLKGER